ncbi:MAG: GNAT family N-acetyltransferase [Candidatus Binatia bacterium]
MTILLTGFNPFGGGSRNISEELVYATQASWRRPDVNLVVEVLPTEFERAGRLIVELIARHRPQMVVSCGLAGDEPCIRFELLARNLDACEAADNAAVCRTGSTIVADGPPEYNATLPYASLGSELSLRGIPYRYSDDAGGFVCNHVFYKASHHIKQEGLPIACGFIHWPSPLDSRASDRRGLPFDVSLDALRVCLDSLLEPRVNPAGPVTFSDQRDQRYQNSGFDSLTSGWALEPVRDTATLHSVIALDRTAFTMPWGPEMFAHAVRSPNVHLLVLRAAGDSQIAGFICYHVSKVLEIATLAVRHDLRRTGLGTRLVKTALSAGAALSISDASLHVRVSNAAGRRLYERLGFVPITIRVDYYHDPVEDGLIYWRRILDPCEEGMSASAEDRSSI